MLLLSCYDFFCDNILILDHEQFINYQEPGSKQTPLMAAVLHGNEKIVKVCIKYFTLPSITSGVAEPRGSGGLQPPQLFGHGNKFFKNEIFLGIQSQKFHYCGPWATQYTEYIKSYIAFFNVPTTLHNPHRVHM